MELDVVEEVGLPREVVVSRPDEITWGDLVNLDGKRPDVAPDRQGHIIKRLNDILHGRTGFKALPMLVKIRGTVGFSELGAHCRIANNTGIVAVANEELSYAYVVTDDGRITDGCFCLFSSGTFSLS